MKIETIYTDDHQAKLTVEFDREPMEEYKRRAARELAKRTKIPGFRPGKAPYHMVERTVGPAAILDEAIDLLVNEQYPKILDEAKIQPYGPGNLTNMPQVDPPILEFTVPLEPTVKLGDYKAIRVAYDLKAVEEQEVDDTLAELQERNTTFDVVERAAQDGDQVTIKLAAERKNPAEGKAVTLIKEREVPVVIELEEDEGSRSWPFPGFSRHLVGLSAGDEKAIEYTYAEDSVLESLRGTEAIFRVKVDAVKVGSQPELDDAFAKTMGEFETMADLRAEIRKSLEERAKSEYEDHFHEQIMEELLKDAEIKFPPQMQEREVEGMVEQLKSRMQEQGVDYATYLKTRQMDDAAFREEIKPSAENRLKRSLVLLEVLKAENIHVHAEELQTETMRLLEQLKEMLPPEEYKKTVQQENMQNLVGNVSSEMLIQNAWKRLEAIAKGEPIVEEDHEEAHEDVHEETHVEEASATETPTVE